MDTKSDVGCLVQVKNLKKYFPIKRGVFSRTVGFLKAVDDVSFSMKQGETLGLVGESGSGKTTLGNCVLRLLEPSDGTVFFEGTNVLMLQKEDLRILRRKMQVVFQDPLSSLNPRMSVGRTLAEGLEIHKLATGKPLQKRVSELLDMVRLSPRDAHKYPHEFSSGQRQRIGIARALSVNPTFIVADEPVSALDVSIQAQLLNLFLDIQKNLNIAYLFITHDLSVVRHMSHRVAVMYLGRIVESAETSTLFRSPSHPYTQSLLSAVPRPDPKSERKRIPVRGEVPGFLSPPSGCPFHPRCTFRTTECTEIVPELKDTGDRHFVSCLKV